MERKPVDLTVVATPFYFASMAAEHLWLKRRAERIGPSAADYTKPDTLASLAMGVGSLLVPLSKRYVLRHLVPGRSKLGTVALATAATAAVATTVADRRLRRRAAALSSTPADAPNELQNWQASGPTGARSLPILPEGGVRNSDGSDVEDREIRRDRVARQVASVGGVVAVVSGGVVAAATAHHLTSATRLWRRHGQRRDLGSGLAAWALALVGWDLVYYLNHRFMHEVRALWAMHVVHHSSEHYNLSTALRQPVAEALGVWVPYGGLAALGVRPSIIEQSRGINLLYQYWVHTDTIRSLGAAEEVLNSPSHHRVHHGSNQQYLDRNHGGILIVWDRLFGTFQREDPDDPPVYGLTKNIDTYNPLRIATHEYRDILRDVAGSSTWTDRLSFVVRGPGWAYRRHAERVGATAAAELVTAG